MAAKNGSAKRRMSVPEGKAHSQLVTLRLQCMFMERTFPRKQSLPKMSPRVERDYFQVYVELVKKQQQLREREKKVK